MRASRLAKRGSSNSVGRSIVRARPSQNFGGDDMCSASHLPSAHFITYDCDTRGRLYGPITSPSWKKWVKASMLKCAIASSIETSTVRPAPVRPRSTSAPRTP